MILHVDMDAFFASIEQTANPKLKGKPLIVGARGNRLHTVVCAASYEAKAYGIDSGMPCKEAFKLCPKAQFVAADSAKYIYASREIFEILKEFSPNTECASVDEFILDLSGLEAILGPLETIAKNIKNRIKERFNITCSIGISTTRTLAKLGSGLNKPDGLTLIQESNLQDILQATPVEKLCGVGSSLKEHLNSLKIYTCQDLFNIPESILSEKFGKVGLWLYDAVRLIEDSPVMASECPKLPPKSIGHSYTLPKPISEKQAIFGWIRLLSEMVGQRLRHKNLQAKTTHLNLVGSTGKLLSKQKSFSDYTFDSYQIYNRCRYIISQSNIPIFRIRAIGVSVSGLSQAQKDLHLFPGEKRREDLIKAFDAINDKFGDWTVFPASVKLTRE